MYNSLNHEMEQKDDVFHREIVETFFGNSMPGTEKKNRSKISVPKPTKNPDEDVLAPAKNAPIEKLIAAPQIVKKSNISYRVPYIVVIGMFVAALVLGAYLTISGIFQKTPGAMSPASLTKTPYSKFISDGAINKGLIKQFSFEGDARNLSLFLSDHIKLVNQGTSGWAQVVMELGEPLDISRANVLIFAKSKPGVGFINIILTDVNGYKARSNISLMPHWQWLSIPVKDSYKFDTRKVIGVTLEFGSVTAGNNQGTEIYVKDFGFRS